MATPTKRKRQSSVDIKTIFQSSKQRRADVNKELNSLNSLPEDIIIDILCRLSSTTSCITDLINVSIKCHKLNGLAFNNLVLSKASLECFSVRAKAWSDSSYRFVKLFVDAGNVDATYMLGMIRFYCLKDTKGGISLIHKAAREFHAPAVYALALIYLNGSGGVRNSEQNIGVGVRLCERAANLGNLNALRELGHCFFDGYGVVEDKEKGRRLLYETHARQNRRGEDGFVPERHPVNLFFMEWFEKGGPGVMARGLRTCMNFNCGLSETRKNNFRTHSILGKANYCSCTCQKRHWIEHLRS